MFWTEEHFKTGCTLKSSSLKAHARSKGIKPFIKQEFIVCKKKYTVRIQIETNLENRAAQGKLWNKNVYSSTAASGSRVSILSSPQLTCRNRCLSYTPFGVGHFFFFYSFKSPNCYSFWNGFRCLLSFNSLKLPPLQKVDSTLSDKACGKLSPLNLKPHRETAVFTTKPLLCSHTWPWVTALMHCLQRTTECYCVWLARKP